MDEFFRMKPYFISFEGIEGVGKSTAIKFFNAQLTNRHIDFVVNREPGGTEISEEIRHVLLQSSSRNHVFGN